MSRKNNRKTLFLTIIAICISLGAIGNVHAFQGLGSGGPGGSNGNANPPHGGGTVHGHGGMTQNLSMAHGEGDETVVALVNGTEVTMGELMRTVKDIIMRDYRNMKLTEELAKRIRYDALEMLAMEKLAYQHALSIGVTADQHEIDSRIAAIKQAEGGEEALQISLARRKKTIEDLKKDISRFLAVKMAIEQEVDRKVAITEEEINEAYKASKEQFITPERVVVTDIIFFLDPKDPASAERVHSIREKIILELDNDPTKLTPSDFVVSSNINVSPENMPELYQAAKKIEVGSLSDPLVIDGTLHLIKYDFHQARKEKAETEAKAVVARKLKSTKKNQLLAKWRQNLLKNANIEIVHELLQENNSKNSP